MRVLIKTSDALDHFKNASRLAEEIGITPQAINQWGEYIPDPSVGKIMAVIPGISYKIVREVPTPPLLTA
ncbi:Cro/CI family transcriptional regulator [Acinetobacter sp. YH12151]|uniref:Cro/CI family transcriptional regulator n=1 Tax=Acinetobacter sp. YH12151 TaxID=2601131 RepID=UPI0015D448AB|nr:Cro/CI family transcriptional regulator [Acinetobacter sp. YH12151]